MNLGRIQARIYKRTNTSSTNWGVSGADMVDALNNTREHIFSIIRDRSDNFYPTAWTTTDLSTGTAIPEFDALFHELMVLWPSYQYQVDANKQSATGLAGEIQTKEDQLKAFYGERSYRIMTATIATSSFTRSRHGLAVHDRVIFSTSGSLPTGVSANVWYYVVTINNINSTSSPTPDDFQVSATKGGTAITLSGSQSGTHWFASDRQPRMKANYQNNK